MNRKYNKAAAENKAGQTARGAVAVRLTELKKEMNKLIAGKMPVVGASSHNVTGITIKGSPISTQIWDGGFRNAVKAALEWYDAGERGKKEQAPWHDPLVHVYIYQHKTGETYFYDLANQAHLAALRTAAL